MSQRDESLISPVEAQHVAVELVERTFPLLLAPRVRASQLAGVDSRRLEDLAEFGRKAVAHNLPEDGPWLSFSHALSFSGIRRLPKRSALRRQRAPRRRQGLARIAPVKARLRWRRRTCRGA